MSMTQRLKQARRKAGLTLREVEERTGIGQSSLSEYEAAVELLDADFRRIATAEVTTFSRRSQGEPDTRFIRGDVNGDGAVRSADAIAVLLYLFVAGEKPRCSKAADVDDNGKLNVGDAVGILRHLFRGAGPFPTPFPGCGVDETPDALDCVSTCEGI